jgi:hypothetical protein
MVDETKELAGTRPPRRAAERRSEPRYRFAATAELFEEESGTQTETRIADISQRGCYVETDRAFPLGTAIRVSISKGPDRFVTQARVVYSSLKGMGLAFSELAPGELQILETWLVFAGSEVRQDFVSTQKRGTERRAGDSCGYVFVNGFTLDLLHVASVLILRPEVFYRFDRRQRKLAKVERLRVLPAYVTQPPIF